MILTVGSTKGGVGKTTLALNLAVSLARTGRNVWLVDGDRQRTASTALSVRGESGLSPTLACAAYSEGSLLRQQLLHQHARFDEVVVDCGGRDSSALRAAMLVTDVLLIPVAPRSFDVWALADLVSLVKEVQQLRDGLRVLAVLNFADATGTDNKDATEAITAHPEITLLDAPLGRRKSFANASGGGMAVTELSPIDRKACGELTRLMQCLYQQSDADTPNLSALMSPRGAVA